MTALSLRSANTNDADIIAEFNCRLAIESEGRALDPATIAAGVHAVLEGRGEAEYLIAESDGRVIGQLMLTREWSDWRNGWFYWIQSVFVVAEHRRRGVFSRLYQEAVARVEARSDSVGLRLYVEVHNAKALETYTRLGMRVTGYEVLEHPLRRELPAITPPANR